jgi:hypothetical protein
VTAELSSGGIFISYRREESSAQAGRLCDNLVSRFGEDHVFMDVDSIGLGLDFVQVIEEAVSSCVALLAVISPGWLEAADEEGHRRLDDPHDFVRIEIQTALKRDVPVVPILLNEARMPRMDLLPSELQPMTRRQALHLHDATFRTDVKSLAERLERVLTSPARPDPPAPKRASAQRGPKAKPPSATPSAELIARDPRRLLLRVDLTEESHIVEVHIGNWAPDWIAVDGAKVAKSTVGFYGGPIEFTLSDGAVRIPVQGAFDSDWRNRLSAARLVVGDTTVYEE